MNPLDTKHTRTDALPLADDTLESMRLSETTALHLLAPILPPGVSNGVAVASPCPCPSSSQVFSTCYRTYSLHQQQQQQGPPDPSIYATSPRALEYEPSVAAKSSSSANYLDTDEAGQIGKLGDKLASSTIKQLSHQGGGNKENKLPVIVPTRSSSLQSAPKQRLVHQYQQLPYRHSQNSPLLASADYCYHYSTAFTPSTSQHLTRSSLRRLRRRSLNRGSGLTSDVSTTVNTGSLPSSASPPFSRSPERHLPQQLYRAQQPLLAPPSLQPLFYNPTYLRGHRRLTIETCTNARQQQQQQVDDQHHLHNVASSGCGANNGLAGVLGSSSRSLSVASSYDSLQLLPSLSPPHMQQSDEDEAEEEGSGSPDLVTAMRPLSSATCCWSDVAIVDSLAEGGLHLGPWASTAAY